MLGSGIPLMADDLLFVVDGLALRSPALADDPGRLCVEIRQLIFDIRLMAANYDLATLQSGLCIAESMLLLRRPAEALAVIYWAAHHCASVGH
jgi:hypothetical protein